MRKVVASSCMAAMLSFGIAAFAQTTGQNPTGSSGQAGSTMTQGRQLGDSAKTQQQVTLVGCIQRESEYRQAAGSGKGGTLGTGVGVGNEFVLINASQGSSMASSVGSPASSTSPSPSDPAATAGTAGTSGTSGTSSTSPSATSSASTTMTTASGKAYALTGDREKDLEQYVGQKVEIVGTLDASAPGASATAGANTGSTGATTSGTGTASTGTTSTGTGTGTTAGATTGATTGSSGATAGISASAGQRFSDLQQISIVSFKAIGACSQ
jgi:hypothetical protein